MYLVFLYARIFWSICMYVLILYVFCTYFCTQSCSAHWFPYNQSYVHIRAYTATNTCKYVQYTCIICIIRAIYVQKFKELVQFISNFQYNICMYMHVYVCIYKKIVYIPKYTNQDRMFMYIHVYVCICTYFNVYCLLFLTPGAHLRQDSIWTCIYLHLYLLAYVCICMYMHVYASTSTYLLEWLPAMLGQMPLPQNTVCQGGSQSAPLRAPRIIRSFTFSRHWHHFCSFDLDLAHIPPPARVQSPWRAPPVPQGSPPIPICAQPVPKAYRKCCVKCKMKCSHLRIN